MSGSVRSPQGVPQSFLGHWLTRYGLLAVVLAVALIGGCRSGKPGGLFSGLTRHKPRPEANVPPRRQVADTDEIKRPDGESSLRDDDINLTEFKPGTNGQPAITLDGATIVARVNSSPIFAEDVLYPFAGKLAQVEKDLSPEDRNRLRARLIQENLSQHVEKAVLVGAMRESMKREELQKLDEQLEKLWTSEEIPRLQKDYKVGTRVELERLLEDQGTSLANLKPSFTSREMAMYYMGQKARSIPKLGPKELREWYDEHKEDFKIDAMVRWQQLQISFKAHGGKNGALKVFNEAILQLKEGAEFGEVVKKYSDGPRKADGGVFDWTSEGSLANKQMNRALSELPTGRISSPIDTGDAWVLIKVLDRQEEGYKPFEDVQKEMAEKLATTARREAADKALSELMANATIWTIFDKAANDSSKKK